MKKKLIIILTIFLCSSLWCKPKFYRADWDKLSGLEKNMTALTAYWTYIWGIDYCDFACKIVRHENWKDANNILSTWGYYNKDKIFKQTKDVFEFVWPKIYRDTVKLLDDTAEKEPALIAKENKLSTNDTGYLFYINDKRSTYGQHGFEAYGISEALLILRLGYGTGLITHEEMEQYATPLVQKALSDYTSLEDFAGHFIGAKVIPTINNYKYNKNVDDEVETWTNAINSIPADEINFTGNTADKTAVMKIEDAVYVPSEYSKPFMEAIKITGGGYGLKGITLINECRKKYGDFGIFDSLYTYLTPIVYDTKDSGSPEDFFEKEYRWLWESLPEYEQFAIACTSNVEERNHLFHLDIGNRVTLSKKSSKCKDILKNKWNISSEEELMQNFEELTQGEQAAVYLKLKNLLLKYPELSVLQIGTKEALSVTEISRMYFVKDKMDLLGEHGLEAWIDARRISILRWGISAGYITEEKAQELIIPIVVQIKENYTSFEEFIAHWIAGYCFNEVYSSTNPDCTIDLINAIETARAYIPFEELVFTGENADKNHCLTIEEAVYTPSAVAQKMIPFQKLYKQANSEQVLKELIKLEQQNPEYKDAMFYYHLVLMADFSSFQERIDFIENNLTYLQSIPIDSLTFSDAYYLYLTDLLLSYYPEKALTVYDALPENFKGESKFYYFYAYANYLMSNLCNIVLERDIYISRAVNAFSRLKQMGVSLGSFIDGWLNAVESL